MPFDPSIRETLKRLQEIAPNAPLLALGQTVFWDEPLKAMIPIIAEQVGVPIRLTAGIHDTDYFAKLPGGVASPAQFVALPKNDGTTKSFWSAAGEFSALFGSETPVTRESLAQAGVYLEKHSKSEAGFLDHITEAYGWRGIAARDSRAQITSELSLEPIFPFLQKTFQWALRESVSLCDTGAKLAAEQVGDRIQTLMCDTRESCSGQTLATFYECLLSDFHTLVAGQKVSAEITRTSQLLSFSTRTAHLPRFQFVELFLKPETKQKAVDAYNRAISGTDTYTLGKFGTGALPFDLIIPGVGRGTIRLTKNSLIVMTPEPKFVSLSSPIESLVELAEVVEEHFGSVVLTGKAVTLISMLSAEFVFAFHETASSYVVQTRAMMNELATAGIHVKANPILRIALDAWDALCAVDHRVSLPAHLQQTFHTDASSGTEFSEKWRSVLQEQCKVLDLLSQARSPQTLIHAVSSISGETANSIAAEYESLRHKLLPLREMEQNLDAEARRIHERLRAIKLEWVAHENSMGDHFRAGRFAQRDGCIVKVAHLRLERKNMRTKLNAIHHSKSEISNTQEIEQTRARRREIEHQAEDARLQIARNAILTKRGLEATNRRPAAWWFPVLSPNGDWFSKLMHGAKFRLEPLVGE